MALPSEPSTPETRAKAQARVRRLTRGAVGPACVRTTAAKTRILA